MRNRHKKLTELVKDMPKQRMVATEVTKSVDDIIIRETPICWGIPMDEVCYARFWVNFLRCANMMPWDGVITTESTYLPSARNTIHNNFLSQSDMPYLFMLDSDIMFPPHIATRLLAHKLPIVGGWYRNKKSDHHPIVYDWVSESADSYNFRHRKEPGKGLEKVDGMGAGCWMMSRKVAEKLGESPYSMHKATEDLNLCKQMMDLNIPLYVDWDIPLAHLGVLFVA